MNQGYSHLIRPLFLLIDLLVISTVIFWVSDKEFLNLRFIIYSILSWIILSYYTGFYKIFRFTGFYRILSLLAVQFILFFLIFFAYFGIFKEGQVVNNQFLVFTSIFFGITFFKFLSFYALKMYRKQGKNYRNVIVVGFDDTAKKIIKMFDEKRELGYRFFGFFSDDNRKSKLYLGTIARSYDYIIEKNIDEVYCSLATLNQTHIKEFTKFANKNGVKLKLIPEATEFYSKNFNLQYYDNTVVLSVNKLPFDYAQNRATKRIFDIIFSILVIVLIMSWLTPLLWLLVKIESRGPLFFKQQREGIHGNTFMCYKFRSMKPNSLADRIHATRDDQRVTRIGSFLRRTSIDEMPQFFNVLKGEMSTVGPRPHMRSLSKEYQKEINNYMERHAVKPGVTGLAQVSGYRGEVKERSDIKNRVRLDIFYIENWSFLLDIKIIVQTILNAFKGEENAY